MSAFVTVPWNSLNPFVALTSSATGSFPCATASRAVLPKSIACDSAPLMTPRLTSAADIGFIAICAPPPLATATARPRSSAR